MRAVLVLALLGCQSHIKHEQELCAKAAAMFDRCEQFASEGSDAKLERELAVDRWRGLCRAVFTGETKQLGPDALAIYAGMADEVKAGLRAQAECTAKTTSCVEYATCSR